MKGGRAQKQEASSKGHNEAKQLPTPETDAMHTVASLLLRQSQAAPYPFLQVDKQPIWAWTLAVAVVEGLSQGAGKAKGVGEKALKKWVSHKYHQIPV